MPSRDRLESEIGPTEQFVTDLETHPDLAWCCDMNVYEKVDIEVKLLLFRSKIQHR